MPVSRVSVVRILCQILVGPYQFFMQRTWVVRHQFDVTIAKPDLFETVYCPMSVTHNWVWLCKIVKKTLNVFIGKAYAIINDKIINKQNNSVITTMR